MLETFIQYQYSSLQIKLDLALFFTPTSILTVIMESRSDRMLVGAGFLLSFDSQQWITPWT